MRWPLAILLCLLLKPEIGLAEPVECRLCGEGGSLTGGATEKARPMALEVRTSLDFDRVILTGPAGGTARLSPDGGRQTEGALTALSGRAMVGEVVIRGEPGRQLRVDLPQRIELYGFGGGALAITRVTSDLPIVPTLGADGLLRIRFGGELFISGDAEGDYRGDVPITVDYL